MFSQDGSYYFNAAPDFYDLTFHLGGRIIGRNMNVTVGVGPADTSAVLGFLNGELPVNWPDEANGDPVPASGSKLPYLSGGVTKIA